MTRTALRTSSTTWFTRTIKALALTATLVPLVALTDRLVLSAGTFGQDLQPQLGPHNLPSAVYGREAVVGTPEDDSAKNELSTVEVSEEAVDTDSHSLLQLSAESTCDVFYMVVSTIDGKISALNLKKHGALEWSVQADARPLYSSSLASMEVVRGGKKIWLIPALDGALYQFDGDKVEPIPVSAETLLSSTYKLGEDSMIVGSKDLRNFGINIQSGQMHFSCGSEGCRNFEGTLENEAVDGSNLIILTRTTQVVRSVDVTNGNEKWNFSVGQYHVSLPWSKHVKKISDDDYTSEGKSVPIFSNLSEECTQDERDMNDESHEHLQLLIPEGRVIALVRAGSSQISWQHQFDSPIAKAWLLHHGTLKVINLFDGRHIPSLSSSYHSRLDHDGLQQPLLYIGSHQNSLYIQASPRIEAILKSSILHRAGYIPQPHPLISWKLNPYITAVDASTRRGGSTQIAQGPHQPGESQLTLDSSTSLTVWHENHPQDTGYFLYPFIEDDKVKEVNRDKSLVETQQLGPGAWWQPVIWLYWKELILISVVLSAMVHVVLKTFTQFSTSPCLDSSETSRQTSTPNGEPALSAVAQNSGEYVSRFATDFECLRCLGKGGFGIVFEAVNKVDDQHYAVKRTTLPRSEGAKDKVLREVKALAKLEHIGIVRYFNAWVESPPAGWQEKRDSMVNTSDMSHQTCFSTYDEDGDTTPSGQNRLNSEIAARWMSGSDGSQHYSTIVKKDTNLYSNSEVLSAQMFAEDNIFKQSSVGYSVVPQISNERDIRHLHKSGWLSEVSTLQKSAGDWCFDNSRSWSSIPFSSNSFSASLDMRSDVDSISQKSGDSIIFDCTGCKSTGISSALGRGSLSDTGDSVVFEGSTPHSHHTVDIPAGSSEPDEKPPKPATRIRSPPGPKLFLYIQMQLYLKETLKDWLRNNTLSRDRRVVLDIFDQIVCAVDYVHSQGLMHRDLKPSNIFFTADGVVKVGDFGLVTELIAQQDEAWDVNLRESGKHTAEVGTTLYMSPEQIARQPYDLKVDIFSLGLIFLEFWVPFSTHMERVQTLHKAKQQIFPTRFIKELPLESGLVHKMTAADPSDRPFTKDILAHPLFKELVPTRIGVRQSGRVVSGLGYS